jgi:hypothetical protein
MELCSPSQVPTQAILPVGGNGGKRLPALPVREQKARLPRDQSSWWRLGTSTLPVTL